MSIAPSKLGQFIRPLLTGPDDSLLRSLRTAGLVESDARDDEVIATFRRARQEHDAIPERGRAFNSPEERVRVFIQPYLSEKGRRWAVPLDSLRGGASGMEEQ